MKSHFGSDVQIDLYDTTYIELQLNWEHYEWILGKVETAQEAENKRAGVLVGLSWSSLRRLELHWR